MDTLTLNLILTVIMPIISNMIQEIFRILSRCKRSKCCNSEFELEPVQKVQDKPKENNINEVKENKV